MNYMRIKKDGGKKSPLYKALEFVAKAVCGQVRYSMEFVNVSGRIIEATDGKRLHWIETDHDLDDGLYNIDSAKRALLITRVDDEMLSKYPSTDLIREKHKELPPLGDFNLKGSSLYTGDNAQELGRFFRKCERGFDLRYMNDITGYHWNASGYMPDPQNKGHMGIYMEAKNTANSLKICAVIMGLWEE